MNRLPVSAASDDFGNEPSGPTDQQKMTTGQVFAVFASAWPTKEISTPTLNLWASQIGDLAPDLALDTAAACVRLCEFWPSVRTFLETLEGVKAARRREAFTAPELVEGRDLDLAKQKVGEIRAALGIAAKHDTKQPEETN
jgi:hypothetical protein